VKWAAAIFLAVLVLSANAGEAFAALPPAELVELRLQAAREARKPTEVRVSVNVSGQPVVSYRGKAKLVSNTAIALTAPDGSALRIHGEAGPDSPGGIIFWLVMHGDVVEGLNARGDFRPATNTVEVFADRFGYRYGKTPSLVVSRDLARVLEVTWATEGVTYEARFDYAEGDWPTAVTVTRAGRPYLRATFQSLNP
jgi:hypothetical protein